MLGFAPQVFTVESIILWWQNATHVIQTQKPCLSGSRIVQQPIGMGLQKKPAQIVLRRGGKKGSTTGYCQPVISGNVLVADCSEAPESVLSGHVHQQEGRDRGLDIAIMMIMLIIVILIMNMRVYQIYGYGDEDDDDKTCAWQYPSTGLSTLYAFKTRNSSSWVKTFASLAFFKALRG